MFLWWVCCCLPLPCAGLLPCCGCTKGVQVPQQVHEQAYESLKPDVTVQGGFLTVTDCGDLWRSVVVEQPVREPYGRSLGCSCEGVACVVR